MEKKWVKHIDAVGVNQATHQSLNVCSFSKSEGTKAVYDELKPMKRWAVMLAIGTPTKVITDHFTCLGTDPDDVCLSMQSHIPAQYKDTTRVRSIRELTPAQADREERGVPENDFGMGGQQFDNDGEDYGPDLWDEM